MDLKKLEVPTSSITEVKKSPMDVFDQARQAGTGVYVFNREKIAGVMLTQEQYEELLDNLSEQQQVAEREPVVDLYEELSNNLKNNFAAGTTVSAHLLDEKMVKCGFISKRGDNGGILAMVIEINESGKLIYYSRKRKDGKKLVAEIIGEQDPQAQLFEKIIIKKIHLLES